MKKLLLIASSKLSRFYFRTLCVLFLIVGISTSSNAQCVGPFQGYESTASTAAIMTTAGWQFIGASAATSFVPTTGSTGVSRSGRNYLRSATSAPTVNAAIISPKVQTPQTFSFYIRGTIIAGLDYSFSFSDDNKATWIPITNGATTLTGGNGAFAVSSAVVPALPGATATIPMSLVTITAAFPADIDGYYFRIGDVRPLAPTSTVGNLQVDDISWTSSVASDNVIIVPDLNNAATCTVTVPASGTYKYYDNGGSSDAYSDGQSNGIIFAPFNPADKVRITFKTFDIITGQETFNVYDSNAIGTGAIGGSPFSGNVLPLAAASPVNSYTSTFTTGEIATRFISDGTYRTTNTNNAVGYEIWVECIANSCADPGVPTVSAITSTGATLTWTGAAPVGYEFTYTTTASPPAGAGTFVASPTVTGNLTGLVSNTVYYGWVRAKCGASNFSNWVMTAASFTTLCAPVGVPYTENFNGLSGPLPTCTSTSGGSWGTNITNGNLFGNSLGQFFFTQPITLAAATVYKLSYDYSSLFGNANFSVYIGTVNNGTMFTTGTLLFNHPAATSSLTNNTLNFTSGAAGTYYIGFYYVSRTGGFTQLNLDNVFLDVETCISPSGVVGSAPTASSGTVNWTAPSIIPSGGYQYYISTSNTAPTSSSLPGGSVASGTSTTISGLTSNTTYYVWVRSSCGGGLTSLWSSSFATFTTLFVVTTTVNMQNGSNGPSPGSCSVNFFDSAGPSGDYADNESYTYTFYPATAGSKLKAVFSSFRTENNYDGLMIYSGTTATPANLISSGLPAGIIPATCPAGSFYGTNTPGTVISTDATGALTFVFTTDASVVFAGWAATLSCVTVPTISSFTPNSNLCGSLGSTPITITGTNFTAVGGVTGVFFNGVPATSFTVVNNTTLTAVVPASGITSGIISVANSTATGYSSAPFFVNSAPPTTTGVTICTGASGNLTTSTTCSGYVNSGFSLSGNLTAGGPTGPILGTSISNTAVCSFNAGVLRNYVGIPFQVSVTGTYTFESSATPAFDTMGYIVRTPFTPGTCSGNWVRGDDDGGVGTFTLLSMVLTAGVDYILYTTSWATVSGQLTNPFSWAITAPAGGQIMTPGVPVMNWYVDASTTTVLGSGNSFNPVGVSGSGLANTNTATAPGGVVYYGACPSNPTCRTATPFVINARPTVTFTAQPGATACAFSNVTYTTQPGQTNYVWTVPGVLNTDYVIVSGGISATDNTVTLQWLTTGVKTVTINYNNAAGCPASAAVSSTATTVSASGLSTTVTPTSASICANVAQTLTATSGSANFFTWVTTSGSLFTDAACTVAYVPGTNFATVYFKGTANALVTVSGTVGGTGCAADANTTITINKAIWNGSVWSNAGVGPSNTISAEFQGNFTSSVNASATVGNLSACSVIVTSGNVLFNRGTLTVQNSVTVSGGTLNFTDTLYNVGLYQVNNVANGAGVYNGGNTGNITFNRTSAPLYRYDYTYWSTPVYPQNLLAMTPNSPQGLFLDYNNAWNYISNPGSVTMVPAKGYAARAPLSYNLPPGLVQNYTAPFIGVPNNGDLSIPIIGGSAQMNLIGNPYPSALSADAFITANPNVNGTLYFWTHNSQSQSPYQYANSDYASYTLAGGTGTSASTTPSGTANTSLPLGFVASGQGFFVKGLTNSTAVFTNSMRVAGSNNQFYRTANQQQQLEKNRYWLNILSPEGAFKQALVGYIETATMDLDRLFDGEVVEAGNAVSLYTKVGDTKLGIQGRALPFDVADTVPLSYRSNAATTYTISIPEADGLFTEQHVYLEDRILNIIHDLTDSAYVFATEAGTFDERFVLRYTTQALGNEHPIFTENSVVVYHNTNGLFINTGNEIMAKVTVFDISGRLLASQKEVNNTLTSFTTLPTTQQVLLVKIEGESGRVITKKVVY